MYIIHYHYADAEYYFSELPFPGEKDKPEWIDEIKEALLFFSWPPAEEAWIKIVRKCAEPDHFRIVWIDSTIKNKKGK